MPRLSIVIPVLGSLRLLDGTLVSVLENRPADCEIIVVHSEPYDDPYDLAGEVQFLKARRGAALAECLGLGLAASRAPMVNVLACGVEVSAGWADAAMRHFRDPQVAAVAAVVLHRGERQRIISAGLGYRVEGVAWRLGQGMVAGEIGNHAGELRGPDTLAAFYRKLSLEAVGGFSPWAADMLTGIDVGLALWRAGFRCVWEPKCVVRAADDAVRERAGFQHGRDAERLFWRWFSAHGRLRSLLAHAALVAGECTIGLWRPLLILRLLGRVCGLAWAMLGNRSKRAGGASVSPVAAPPAPAPAVIALPRSATASLGDRRRRAQAA